MSLEEKICINKLAAETQRENKLNLNEEYILLLNMEIPRSCMSYFQKGCYTCNGKEDDRKVDCKEYFILQE